MTCSHCDLNESTASLVLILRSRGLTDAEIEKARRWNRTTMYALQDTAQFTRLLDASNAIGAQKHSRTELKRAFLRMELEAKGKYLQSDRNQKPERLLRALEEQNADEGTAAFCRGRAAGREDGGGCGDDVGGVDCEGGGGGEGAEET
jgi:hypothetical protein